VYGFSALCHRHRIESGPLVHVGNAQGREIPGYYDAGFADITIVESAPDRVKALRTRFPGVDVQEVTGEAGFRLDAACPFAAVAVVNIPGHELAVLEFAPWDSLRLLIVTTSASDNSAGASSYDLLTEITTTRGFVEIDRWKRTDTDLDVAFVKLGRDEQ
jgi:hypothetical protein